MAEFTLGTMYWINPRLTSDEVLHDFSDIQANGFSLVRVIAWWELVEPEEGNFTFDHLDRVFRAAEQQHLQLMPTIGFYPPVWLTRKLDAIGKNESGRYPMVLRKEMQRPLGAFIEKLVTRYRNSNVLAMWNVWNEPTVNDSVNSDRLAHFADWLKRHYLDFDQLKQAWFGEYPVFSLLLPHSMEELTAEWLADAFRYGTRGRDCMVRHDWLLLPQFNTCSSSGVFDRLLMKKSFDLLRLFLNASHMGFCMFFKLSIPICRRSFGKGRFQIPVQ